MDNDEKRTQKNMQSKTFTHTSTWKLDGKFDRINFLAGISQFRRGFPDQILGMNGKNRLDLRLKKNVKDAPGLLVKF